MIVLSLCAIVKMVQSSNWVLMVDWMRLSVSRSIAAVASSRMRILVFLRSALAKHTSCLWPTLRYNNKWLTTKKTAGRGQSSRLSPLNTPEVLSSLRTLQLQFCRLVADKLVEVRVLQGFPHVFVAVLVKGVQVHSQGPREQHGLLGQKQDFKEAHAKIKEVELQIWSFL